MKSKGKHWNSSIRPALVAGPGGEARSLHRLNNPLLRKLHRNSFTALFLALLMLFIIQGWILSATFLGQGSMVALLLCGTMAIQALRYSDRTLGITCAVGSITVFLNWIWWAIIPLLPDENEYAAQGIGLLVLALVLAHMVGITVYHLWHNDYTGRNALFCAASTYLLIGFLWSCFFALISYFTSDAFANNGIGTSIKMEGTEIHESFHRFFYFSMITITTVGYGDMTPVAPLARSLAWMEAAIGQFFFGVVLTRLVASQFVQSGEMADQKVTDKKSGEQESNEKKTDVIAVINPPSSYSHFPNEKS